MPKFLLKRLIVTLLLLISFALAKPAYSRGGGGGGGGCFGSETSILTLKGNKKIAQLHPGDYVTNYNFVTHHRERGIISKIEVIKAPDYYLINHRTKVTATHPFYVQKKPEIKLNKKTLPGFIKAAIILFFIPSCIVYWQQISNFFLFFCKKFTEDSELIEFATKNNPDFKNKYSVWYFKDDQIWQEIPPQPELAEIQYQHLISKTEVVEQVSNLFFQYQHDWTLKDFQSMTSYVHEPFYSQQKQIFKQNLGNNFDIIYDCNLSQIIPVDLELKEDRYYFRIQINGKMINFQLSEAGYILTGKSYSRSFSEYWDIELKHEDNWDNRLETPKKCYLVNITQISDSNLE
jgi:hypothetical protein